MNGTKQELESLCRKFDEYWLNLMDACEKSNYDGVDLLCRQIQADVSTMKDLAFELKFARDKAKAN